MNFLRALAATAVTFLALDALWLRWAIASFYPERIGHLMADDFRLGAVTLFYSLYLVIVVLLAIEPGARPSAGRVASRGALLGLFGYGTYGFTNLAVLRDWPLGMTLIDTGWGIFATSVAALAGWAASRRGRT